MLAVVFAVAVVAVGLFVVADVTVAFLLLNHFGCFLIAGFGRWTTSCLDYLVFMTNLKIWFPLQTTKLNLRLSIAQGKEAEHLADLPQLLSLRQHVSFQCSQLK